MINNNYTNFWNDIQRQTSIVDDVDTKPRVFIDVSIPQQIITREKNI